MHDSLNILMIEDVEDDALLVVRQLRRSGLQIHWERVQTAVELRIALNNRSWDVVISDYRLPGFDAPSALEIVKQSSLDLPFIVVSGTIGETLAVELMKAGAHDYLMKDNLTRLPEAVRREIRDAQIRAERQQATVELDQTKELLHRAIAGANIGTWDWYIQTGEVGVNDRCMEMLGYRLADFTPMRIETWRQYTHPEDLPLVLAALDRHFRGETALYECEFRAHHRLGHWVWILDRGKVIESDAQGKPIRMAGTHLDISDRKQAEILLAKRDHYLSVLVEVQRLLLATPLNPEVYQQILSRIGSVADADRMYVFENHWDEAGRLCASQRAEWCVPGIEPQLENPLLQNVPYEILAPTWLEQLSQGNAVQGVVQDFPEPERSILESQAIQSILVLPLLVNSELFGFIGFDNCIEVKQWDDLEVGLLNSAAAAIALAKEREQANQALAQLNRELEDRVAQRTSALQQSEAKLQSILTFAPEIIYVKDLDGRYTLVNPAFLSFLNGTETTIIGKTDLEIFSPETAKILQVNDRTVVATGQMRQFEETLKVNETVHTFLSNKFLLCDLEGKPYALCGISTDISDRKQAEDLLHRTNAELARATRLKDEFLANMSHELRTPLNAILGMTESLQEEIFGSITAQQRKSLETVERSSNHLLELINDILDLSKIESGQIDLHYSLTSVHSLCQSSLAFIKQQALKKQLKLKVNIPASLPELWIDERRIRQVLINLLNNAVKFTPEGGSITLEVTRQSTPESKSNAITPQPTIRFSVVDTGIGVAPQDIRRLFEPFVQIDSALNRQYSGTGLGLSLVKRLVELHGGTVGVISEVGVGSQFFIDLPYVHTDETLSSDWIDSSTVSSDCDREITDAPLILLAEDNEANVLTISSYLMAKGYRLMVASHGQEAIEMVETFEPNLILMDIQMPGMDGIEAIKRIRSHAKFNQLPIIVLTALAMTGDREKYLQHGANDYLSKPVRLKQLSTRIQQFLATE